MEVKHDATITGEGYGYVYVMSYPGSDKVKIGHAKNPTTRAADIGGTLAPETPQLEAYFWCSERREAVERAAHDIERDTRHNGEWFCIPVTRAIDVIRHAAGTVGVSASLVYDRNEWEAKREAEQRVRDAAIAALKGYIQRLEQIGHLTVRTERTDYRGRTRFSDTNTKGENLRVEIEYAIDGLIGKNLWGYNPEKFLGFPARVEAWAVEVERMVEERAEKAKAIAEENMHRADAILAEKQKSDESTNDVLISLAVGACVAIAVAAIFPDGASGIAFVLASVGTLLIRSMTGMLVTRKVEG